MLGTRIAALRREAGLSQAELAQRLQVSPSALGMYEQERREPSMQTLVKLSRELGVTTDYLLTGTPAEKEREELEEMLLGRIRAADQRRAGPAQVIAFFGNRRRLIGKIAGFGQLAGVHFEPERLLHFANRGFESLGNRLHGIVVVHADRRMKRVETVGKIILTRKILKDALSLLTGL